MPLTVEATISRSDDTHATIEITVPFEDIEKSIKKTINKLRKTQKFKGFRQGKVPEDVVYTVIGKEGIHAEVLSELVPYAYQEALRKVNAVPMGQPEFSPDLAIEEGKPLEMKVTVEVLPEVKLPPIDSFDLDIDESVEVTDKDVGEYIDNFLSQRAESSPVDGRPCAAGDEVALDYRITDKEEQEFENMSDIRIILGHKLILPEIEKQIDGMSKDEEKTFPVSYPENYQNDKLAGKDMNVTVTLKEIKERKVPELTDEVLEKEKLGTVEKFREQVKAELIQMRNYMKEQEIRALIMKKLIDETEFNPPEKLVEQDFKNNLLATEQDLERRGTTIEDFLKENSLTYDGWKNEERLSSVRRIKMGAIIGNIFESENLEITQDDIGLELSRFAVSNRIATADLKKLIKETDLHDRIILNLKERKVLDLLRLRAKCTGKKEEEKEEISEEDAGGKPAAEEQKEAPAEAGREDE
ncbi:MAG: trigger factor [bacterium]